MNSRLGRAMWWVPSHPEVHLQCAIKQISKTQKALNFELEKIIDQKFLGYGSLVYKISNELTNYETHSLLEIDCHHDVEMKIGSLRPCYLDNIGNRVIMTGSYVLQCVMLCHLVTHYLIFKMTLG